MKKIRDATRMLSEQLDGDIKSSTLRSIYARQKMVANATSNKSFKQLRIPEKSKAISDLSKLIDNIVKEGLNKLGGLLTASEWGRSAFVRAWVSKKKGTINKKYQSMHE